MQQLVGKKRFSPSQTCKCPERFSLEYEVQEVKREVEKAARSGELGMILRTVYQDVGWNN